jgi:hypothetical protein
VTFETLYHLGKVFLILLAAVTLPSRATANTDNRIAVVGLTEDNALARQLKAELLTLEFQVVFSDEPVGSWRALRDLARRLKVAAAVWITAIDQPTIEIWVVDLVTGKTVQRSIEWRLKQGRSSPRVLAMRVIELLRASFREVAPSSQPPQEGEVKPSSAVRAMAGAAENDGGKQPKKGKVQMPSPEKISPLSLRLGLSVEAGSGGIKPSVHALVGLNWLFSDPWGIATYLLAPTVSVTLAREKGSADILISSIGIGPYYLFSAPASSWRPDIGLAIASIACYMEGKSVDPFNSKSTVATSAAFFSRIGLSVRATSRIGIRAEALVGSVVPRIVVRFADQDQARWGRLYGVGTLGLDIVL